MKNIRKYGPAPYAVAVIHGGPGAAGEMAPVARELSAIAGILEPLQTATSIDQQIQELNQLLQKYGTPPFILVGHSWGAWLSFIFTARYYSIVKKLILISSGAFEEKYVLNLMETRLNRLNQNDRLKVENLKAILNDPEVKNKNAAMSEFGRLMAKADSYNPFPYSSDKIECQFHIFEKVWPEASALRKSGALLKIGEQIHCPVVAIHGDSDTTPAEGIEAPLTQVLPDFRFRLLNHCGHTPWNEREARAQFYEILKAEVR